MKWTKPAEKKFDALSFALVFNDRIAMRILAENIAQRNDHKSVGVSQVKAAFRHKHGEANRQA